MNRAGCDAVARYLDLFLKEGGRAAAELDRVSEHVGTCPSCYARLSNFFRTVELPESSYLRETIDELALALYNLAKAVIRDRPARSEAEATENLRITQPGGGSAEENVQAGVEMIEDAEDYVGASRVGDLDLEDLRARLADASTSKTMKIDLAIDLFRRLTALESRYAAKAWNWIGVLHLQKNELDQAEAAFLRALAAKQNGEGARAFAHCNLGYVFKHRGDLDRAIKSASRSIVLAEEDGEDPYFGRFAELYFRLLRNGPDDASAAAALLATILRKPGRAALLSDLALQANRPVRDAVRNSGFGKDFPELS